jgi:hypothetical protein
LRHCMNSEYPAKVSSGPKEPLRLVLGRMRGK